MRSESLLRCGGLGWTLKRDETAASRTVRSCFRVDDVWVGDSTEGREGLHEGRVLSNVRRQSGDEKSMRPVDEAADVDGWRGGFNGRAGFLDRREGLFKSREADAGDCRSKIGFKIASKLGVRFISCRLCKRFESCFSVAVDFNTL